MKVRWVHVDLDTGEETNDWFGHHSPHDHYCGVVTMQQRADLSPDRVWAQILDETEVAE